MTIKARITTENANAGYMISLQIHNGEIGFTEITDAEWERPIVDDLKGGGDLEASLPDTIDLITRLVEATTFKPGQKVTWKGARTGAPRHGTVVRSEPGGFMGPNVIIRTDKGGYTTVAAVYLERVAK